MLKWCKKRDFGDFARGRSAASASLLAAKGELLGTLDAMLSEEWKTAHPVEAAERRQLVEGVLAKSK